MTTLSRLPSHAPLSNRPAANTFLIWKPSHLPNLEATSPPPPHPTHSLAPYPPQTTCQCHQTPKIFAALASLARPISLPSPPRLSPRVHTPPSERAQRASEAGCIRNPFYPNHLRSSAPPHLQTSCSRHLTSVRIAFMTTLMTTL